MKPLVKSIIILLMSATSCKNYHEKSEMPQQTIQGEIISHHQVTEKYREMDSVRNLSNDYFDIYETKADTAHGVLDTARGILMIHFVTKVKIFAKYDFYYENKRIKGSAFFLKIWGDPELIIEDDINNYYVEGYRYFTPNYEQGIAISDKKYSIAAYRVKAEFAGGSIIFKLKHKSKYKQDKIDSINEENSNLSGRH